MKNLLWSISALLILGLNACSKQLDITDDGCLVPETVIENPNLPFIDVDGIKLHSEAFGNPEDPIILVIHGGPGADYRGQLNFKQLAEDGFYVVFYDQRGSGLSQRLNDTGYPAVEVYINELDGVINHYRKDINQKVILAGHSWGAMLAAAYINKNPNKVDGSIFAEPGGFTWDETIEYISRTRKFKLFREPTNDFVYQDQFVTASDHNVLDYKLGLSISSDVNTGDVAPPPFWRYGWVCNQSSIDLAINDPEKMDFTTNLKDFTPKTLFVYSELNKSYGKEHATLVASHLSYVELHEVKGCGHEIPEFGWSNYYPIVKNYLNEIL